MPPGICGKTAKMPQRTLLLYPKATLQRGNNIKLTSLCEKLISFTRLFNRLVLFVGITVHTLTTNSCQSSFRMNSNNETNETGSLSQRSGTTEVTEHMKVVDLNAPVPLTRDQRRLLDHLRKKFNIAEDVALERARGHKRRKRTQTSQPTPCKQAKSEPRMPVNTKASTDHEEAVGRNRAKSNTPKGKAGKVEGAKKGLPTSATNFTHKREAKTGRAAIANSAPQPSKGKAKETKRADHAINVSSSKKVGNHPPPPPAKSAEKPSHATQKHNGRKSTITLADALV